MDRLWNRVLLPIDFSDCSAGAVNDGMRLVQETGCELIFLHVVEPDSDMAAGDALKPTAERATSEMTRFVQDLVRGTEYEAAAASPKVRLMIRHGVAWRTILEVAEEERVDLILIGSTGVDSLDAAVVGSTAEKVYRGTHAPTAVLRPERDFDASVVLAPVDLSAASRHALETAARVSKAYGGRLHVLHVHVTPYHAFLRRTTRGDKLEEIEKDSLQEDAAAFDLFLQGANLGGAPYEKAIRSGRPYREIVSAAREFGATLIVLGAHREGSLENIAVGSVSERVIRLSRVPVLIDLYAPEKEARGPAPR